MRRRAIGEPLRREVRRLIAHRPLPLALLQEPCRPPERVVVERRLDREDLDVFGEQLAHPHRRVVQCRRRRVHVRLRVHHGVDVVVVTDAAVAGQSDRHALVSAVHRHQVDVHVHDQIALGRAFIDLDLFALLGLADEREVRAILRVVVVERLRVERAVHPLPHRALQLRRRHTPVQRKRGDDLDVVHAGARGGLEHVLHDAPADVRRLHLRQRQRDVVERDRQFHPGLQQRRQRLAVFRVLERVRDERVHIADAGEWLGRVHDAAPERQLLQTEPFAVVEQQRRRPFVDLQHETRSRHQFSLGSNATLVVPSFPADNA